MAESPDCKQLTLAICHLTSTVKHAWCLGYSVSICICTPQIYLLFRFLLEKHLHSFPDHFAFRSKTWLSEYWSSEYLQICIMKSYNDNNIWMKTEKKIMFRVHYLLIYAIWYLICHYRSFHIQIMIHNEPRTSINKIPVSWPCKLGLMSAGVSSNFMILWHVIWLDWDKEPQGTNR